MSNSQKLIDVNYMVGIVSNALHILNLLILTLKSLGLPPSYHPHCTDRVEAERGEVMQPRFVGGRAKICIQGGCLQSLYHGAQIILWLKTTIRKDKRTVQMGVLKNERSLYLLVDFQMLSFTSL